MTARELAAMLKGVKPMGKGWTALCPAHEDRSPSLKVDEGQGGRVLVRCHAGCTSQAIVEALGLTLSDLYQEGSNTTVGHPDAIAHPRGYRVEGAAALEIVAPSPDEWRTVTSYIYEDTDRTPLIRVERKEPSVQLGTKRQKRFVQWQWKLTGWIPGLEGIEQKPLFRLPQLFRALEDKREVLICEGEKDVLTAVSLGYAATTNLGGSNGWRPEYGALFKNAHVLIVIDNDAPGRKWAEVVASSCALHNATVRMLALPLDTEGADLTDWHTAGGTREQFDTLVSRARTWQPGDSIPTPPRPSRFHIYSPLDLQSLPELEWLADGVFPARSSLCITGQPGTGKSFVALGMALSVASGELWLGRRVKSGPVLYIAGEGGGGFRKRVFAWCEMFGADPAAIPAHFILEAANLFGSDDVTHVLRACETLTAPPALVVFDTLHRSMVGGDENSAQDMGVVLSRADKIKHETGAATLFVHHNRKDSDAERGSGAIRGAVDTLALVKGEEDGPRTLSCEKQKDFDEFAPISFVLTPHGESCLATLYDPALDDRPERLTSKRRAALLTLLHIFAGPRGATATEWQEASSIPRSTFYNVRAWLVRQRYVHELAAGASTRYTITDAGKWACANPQMTGGVG